MKIAGIVAEYNPFHNGHAHHIARTRAADGGCGATHIVAVMSGCFVQRGEPALLPKADRVRMALANGVDLVLELPVPWSLCSAEGFAFGAVSLLEALGCVDVLSFGSECGDLSAITTALNSLEHPRFSALLAYHMEGGYPFPEARQKAVAEVAGNTVASLFSAANNTLAIEYGKALRRLHSPMNLFTVKRFGAAHDASLPAGDMASASYLRALLAADRLTNAAAFMPGTAAAILMQAVQDGHAPMRTAYIERALLARLRTMTKEEMAGLPGLSEGLENRLYAVSRQAGSLEELITGIKTRRYPRTRIQRLLWAAFLGLHGEWGGQTPPYIRVLGLNEKGEEILRAAKIPALPMVSRPAQAEGLTETARQIWAWECRAADLYALCLPQPPPCGTEHTNGVLHG